MHDPRLMVGAGSDGSHYGGEGKREGGYRGAGGCDPRPNPQGGDKPRPQIITPLAPLILRGASHLYRTPPCHCEGRW